jgi:hypothetical protein
VVTSATRFAERLEPNSSVSPCMNRSTLPVGIGVTAGDVAVGAGGDVVSAVLSACARSQDSVQLSPGGPSTLA